MKRSTRKPPSDSPGEADGVLAERVHWQAVLDDERRRMDERCERTLAVLTAKDAQIAALQAKVEQLTQQLSEVARNQSSSVSSGGVSAAQLAPLMDVITQEHEVNSKLSCVIRAYACGTPAG
jgi:hypothetical protein